MVACCYSAGQRKEEYLSVAGHYEKEELTKMAKAMAMLVNEMEAHPFRDVLGPYCTEITAKSTVAARGEFHTPQEVAEVMARLSLNPDEVIEKGKPITVSDPCCGSGGLVLSLAKLFAPKAEGEPSHVDLIRATLVDVNPIAADMAFINTTLWGIPAEIILGNSLQLELRAGWKNLHWARVGEDQRRETENMVGKMQEVLSHVEKEQKRQEPDESKPDISFGQDGEQMTFL
ncbi:MAG: N-6 DNA methylase [Verrucomicrobiota bacterium]